MHECVYTVHVYASITLYNTIRITAPPIYNVAIALAMITTMAS